MPILDELTRRTGYQFELKTAPTIDDIAPRYVKTHSSAYLNVVLAQTAAGGGVEKTLK